MNEDPKMYYSKIFFLFQNMSQLFMTNAIPAHVERTLNVGMEYALANQIILETRI